MDQQIMIYGAMGLTAFGVLGSYLLFDHVNSKDWRQTSNDLLNMFNSQEEINDGINEHNKCLNDNEEQLPEFNNKSIGNIKKSYLDFLCVLGPISYVRKNRVKELFDN
ncbi:hypothetical protein ACFL1H_08050 [Nanoarchaeota archaeon]